MMLSAQKLIKLRKNSWASKYWAHQNQQCRFVNAADAEKQESCTTDNKYKR